MKASSVILLVASLWICFVSCATIKPAKPKPEEKKPPVEGPKLVGRIATIPPDRRFVLIQSYGKWEVETGRILVTRGPDDRTANLKTTGESLGDFVAADLQSGELEVGDAVYFQTNSKPPTGSLSPELPSSQSKMTGKNVQKNN